MEEIRFSAAHSLGAARSCTPAFIPTSEMIANLRLAAPKLGLSAQVMRSLEVLLACLPPKRNHHMVFASNETLKARSGGLHERSLRRHIAIMVEQGLLHRVDSPNGKRYSSFDPQRNMVLRFGFDLTPLFARFTEIQALAKAAHEAAQALRYIRQKLRAAAHRLLQAEPDHPEALAAQKAARRNLSQEALTALLTALPQVREHEAAAENVEQPLTPHLSGSGGQNDRHHLNISKEHIDKKEEEVLAELSAKETEAEAYAPNPIKCKEDVTAHARLLAPMIGIAPKLYQEACEDRGEWTVASLIWMLLQQGAKIARPAAYFHALTLGKKAESYQPWAWLAPLRQKLSADNSH